MIKRYSDTRIEELFSEQSKVAGWDKLELAVIKAREEAGLIPEGVYEKIRTVLKENPVNLDWWKRREVETNHDLNAYIDERNEHIPKELQQYFHAGMTSYDTEEVPFQLKLIEAAAMVSSASNDLLFTLGDQARIHAATPMLARTHGQEAKIQSFGKRLLGYHQNLTFARDQMMLAADGLRFSKLSGAIGNYQGLNPALEEAVLEKFNMKPYFGATQIIPRHLHAALADAVARLINVVCQIALDCRLSARSGAGLLLQEPFGKKQKGSSAMPHKKNPIMLEQMEGMRRMANAYASALRENIITWEERAIEQSCVERVFWPDLFHVALRVLTSMHKFVRGMTIYHERMLAEIKASKELFASEDVKDFLKHHGAPYGMSHEDAYRITQLAAFLTHGSDVFPLSNYIRNAELRTHPSLDATSEDIEKWNGQLKQIFSSREVIAEFFKITDPAYQLRNEPALFEKALYLKGVGTK